MDTVHIRILHIRILHIRGHIIYFRVENKFAGGKFREIPCAVDIYFAGGHFRAKSKFANTAKIPPREKYVLYSTFLVGSVPDRKLSLDL